MIKLKKLIRETSESDLEENVNDLDNWIHEYLETNVKLIHFLKFNATPKTLRDSKLTTSIETLLRALDDVDVQATQLLAKYNVELKGYHE